MPFLALVHLRELHCSECKTLLALGGARSFVVDSTGDPVSIEGADGPQEMTVEIVCPRGHATTLFVPNEIGAEETLVTPADAPLGRDAMVIS